MAENKAPSEWVLKGKATEDLRFWSLVLQSKLADAMREHWGEDVDDERLIERYHEDIEGGMIPLKFAFLDGRFDYFSGSATSTTEEIADVAKASANALRLMMPLFSREEGHCRFDFKEDMKVSGVSDFPVPFSTACEVYATWLNDEHGFYALWDAMQEGVPLDDLFGGEK